jgi:serine/threonine protein kinase
VSELPDSQLRKLQRLVASPKLPERPLRSKPENGPAAVLGNYTLHQALGPRTWEATHARLPGRLVVRLLANDPAPDRMAKAMASLREIAKINSPVIVPNMKIARTGSIHFLVREFIPGQSMSTWSGPPRTGLLAFYQMARALQAAHEQKQIHSNLTPHNIVIDDAGRPFILDFGLRRIGRALSGRETGRADVSVDASDLGTLFLALVTGRPPSEFLNSEVPAPLPSIDPRVDSLIRNLASRILGDSFPTTRDLADQAGMICQKLPAGDSTRIELIKRFEQKLGETSD